MKKIEVVCPECGHRIVTDADDSEISCEKCGCIIDNELAEILEG